MCVTNRTAQGRYSFKALSKYTIDALIPLLSQISYKRVVVDRSRIDGFGDKIIYSGVTCATNHWWAETMANEWAGTNCNDGCWVLNESIYFVLGFYAEYISMYY